jgi:hypothetical protein
MSLIQVSSGRNTIHKDTRADAQQWYEWYEWCLERSRYLRACAT